MNRNGRLQVRDVEPPGFIHLPKLGLTPHDQIEYFLGKRQYCSVKLRGKPERILLSEPLAYFAKRLPHFIQGKTGFWHISSQRKLVNPISQSTTL